MSGLDLLLWADRALSLFNTIAFLWLGLAVLLNAQRRVPGTWVVAGGLLTAGLFFAVHTTLVGRQFGTFEEEMAFWWRFLGLLFVAPPYLWYVAISWYAGVLGAGPQRATLAAISLFGVVVLALPSVTNLLPTYEEVVLGTPAAVLTLGPVPVVLLVYPVYSALCYVLALVGLLRPSASRRFMGDLARRRARPWLIAASTVLLAVGIAVGSATVRYLDRFQTRTLDLRSPEALTLLTILDLIISALLGIVAVLLGKAVVAYEVFTGKALPRGGLLRHWRNSLILALGYGVVMGGSLALPVDPIYRLMLATLLIVLFYALLAWRSFVEREQGMERLRPFVTSQRLYEQLLAPATPLEVETALPFRVLCDDLLGTRIAYLVALGPMAPLAGTPLAYPPGAAPPLGEIGELLPRLPGPEATAVRVDASRFAGAVWAVPLWSERGLAGLLLLGEKRDGGLYAQEEIEIARAAAERLLDTRASAEMARRLMALQRQRVAESQLLDRRTRRVLHDDILPRLHAALLALSGVGVAGGPAAEALESLAEAHRGIAALLREMPAAPVPEVTRLGLVGALRRAVEQEMSGSFDGVTWRIEPEAEAAARSLSPLAAEVMYSAAREAMRNAARHGRDREAAHPLHLTVSARRQDGLRIDVEDDGVGFGAAGAEGAGSGQGLALHGTMMAVLGGTLALETTPGARTRVSLVLPGEAG